MAQESAPPPAKSYWTAGGRWLVFLLAASSIACLLFDFYRLCPMRLFTVFIFMPALAALLALTTRSAEKIAALEQAGADLAIDTSREKFEQAIPARWGPDAVAVILDPIGADTLSGDLSVLSTGGRVISLATLSGRHASVDLGDLMRKRARLIGSTLRSRPRSEKAAIVERFRREVLPAFEDGRLRVTIDSVFPPERAAEAFRRMRENRNTGKIVIDWTQPNR